MVLEKCDCVVIARKAHEGWVPMYVDKKWLKVDDLHHCQNVQKNIFIFKLKNKFII
jgi:hypothetical protein